MEIVQYAHPALRWKSKPVREINADLRRIVAEMFDLMYQANGIGLAANQVGLPIRLFILNLTGDSNEKDEEIVFVNPEIRKRKGTIEGEEGCLSLPGLYAQVRRAGELMIDAFDLKGQGFELTLTKEDDLGTRAVQHETDHLDGVLFIDRLAEGVRKDKQGVIDDFEAKFRRRQAEGQVPSDAELLKELAELEKKYT